MKKDQQFDEVLPGGLVRIGEQWFLQCGENLAPVTYLNVDGSEVKEIDDEN